MDGMYSPRDSRRVLIRWAFLLASCLVISVLLNFSFARYLLVLREGDPDTHLDRAESQMAVLDLKGAMVSVENALDRAPLYPRAHKVHGDILFKKQEWKSAEDAYRRCLDLGGFYDGVQNNVLWALIEQGEYDIAITLGKSFLDREGASRMAPRYVAEAYMRAERWRDAVTYLNLALESNPKELYLLRRLRAAYGRLGMKAEEDRALEQINAVELELERAQQLEQAPEQ